MTKAELLTIIEPGKPLAEIQAAIDAFAIEQQKIGVVKYRMSVADAKVEENEANFLRLKEKFKEYCKNPDS